MGEEQLDFSRDIFVGSVLIVLPDCLQDCPQLARFGHGSCCLHPKFRFILGSRSGHKSYRASAKSIGKYIVVFTSIPFVAFVVICYYFG